MAPAPAPAPTARDLPRAIAATIRAEAYDGALAAALSAPGTIDRVRRCGARLARRPPAAGRHQPTAHPEARPRARQVLAELLRQLQSEPLVRDAHWATLNAYLLRAVEAGGAEHLAAPGWRTVVLAQMQHRAPDLWRTLEPLVRGLLRADATFARTLVDACASDEAHPAVGGAPEDSLRCRRAIGCLEAHCPPAGAAEAVARLIELLQEPDSRLRALALILRLARPRGSPINRAVVSSEALLASLLACLTSDSASAVVAASILAVATLLPNMPAAAAARFDDLANALMRALLAGYTALSEADAGSWLARSRSASMRTALALAGDKAMQRLSGAALLASSRPETPTPGDATDASAGRTGRGAEAVPSTAGPGATTAGDADGAPTARLAGRFREALAVPLPACTMAYFRVLYGMFPVRVVAVLRSLATSTQRVRDDSWSSWLSLLVHSVRLHWGLIADTAEAETASERYSHTTPAYIHQLCTGIAADGPASVLSLDDDAMHADDLSLLPQPRVPEQPPQPSGISIFLSGSDALPADCHAPGVAVSSAKTGPATAPSADGGAASVGIGASRMAPLLAYDVSATSSPTPPMASPSTPSPASSRHSSPLPSPRRAAPETTAAAATERHAGRPRNLAAEPRPVPQSSDAQRAGADATADIVRQLQVRLCLLQNELQYERGLRESVEQRCRTMRYLSSAVAILDAKISERERELDAERATALRLSQQLAAQEQAAASLMESHRETDCHAAGRVEELNVELMRTRADLAQAQQTWQAAEARRAALEEVTQAMNDKVHLLEQRLAACASAAEERDQLRAEVDRLSAELLARDAAAVDALGRNKAGVRTNDANAAAEQPQSVPPVDTAALLAAANEAAQRHQTLLAAQDAVIAHLTAQLSEQRANVDALKAIVEQSAAVARAQSDAVEEKHTALLMSLPLLGSRIVELTAALERATPRQRVGSR